MRQNPIPRGLMSPVYASAGRVPRSLISNFGPAVRAQANGGRSPEHLLAELTDGVETFKADHRAQLADIQTSFDDMNKRIAAMGLNGAIVIGDEPASDPAYTNLFASYARSGTGSTELLQANREGVRRNINAAMSESPGEAGGYLAPVEWDRRIVKAQRALSPFRQIVTVISTSVRGYSTVWSPGGWGTGWVGETASRPATTTPDLRPLTFAHGELYAFPMVSQQLVDDADFNLEDWLTTEVADEFDRQESIAFMSGDGINKPRGLLTYVTGGVSETEHPGGVLDASTKSGAAASITGDGFITMVYSLATPYRQNARWLMNSATAAAATKLKDGQGAYLWRESFIVGQPATILGYPVTIEESMPDIAAGATPIAFGDFARGYVINDRIGTRVLRDPYTAKPFVGFYTTKRVGGGVLDPKAIRLMKIAA